MFSKIEHPKRLKATHKNRAGMAGNRWKNHCASLDKKVGELSDLIADNSANISEMHDRIMKLENRMNRDLVPDTGRQLLDVDDDSTL